MLNIKLTKICTYSALSLFTGLCFESALSRLPEVLYSHSTQSVAVAYSCLHAPVSAGGHQVKERRSRNNQNKFDLICRDDLHPAPDRLAVAAPACLCCAVLCGRSSAAAGRLLGYLPSSFRPCSPSYGPACRSACAIQPEPCHSTRGESSLFKGWGEPAWTECGLGGVFAAGLVVKVNVGKNYFMAGSCKTNL